MRQCRFYMGRKRRQSRRIEDTAEERRIDSTAEKSEASPTAEGRTRPVAGVTRRTCVSEQAPERTLCRGVEAGSSSQTREYENDVHDSRRDKEMFE